MSLLSSIRQRLSNQDNKTLVQNFTYLTILQVAGYIFPLLTMPYLARVVGVEGVGKVAWAAAVIVWLQTVTDWGFNFTATRDIARLRDNLSAVEQIFNQVFWSKILLMLLSAVGLALLIVLVPTFRSNALLLVFSFLIVPATIFMPEWFFQAMEQMKYITILNVVAKFLFTLLVFLVIKHPADYIWQPLLISLGSILAAIIAMTIIRRHFHISIHLPNWREIGSCIKHSTDVFINNLMPTLYNSFSIMLLGWFGGGVANGKLEGGNKLVTISQQFMTILSRTFFPYLSRRADKHIVYRRITLSCAAIISLLLIVLAKPLVFILFSPEFVDSVLVLRIMAISIFFIALCNVFGTNYLILHNHEKPLRNLTIIVSLVGFALSWLLIYYYSFIGAAVTITLTRGLLGIGTWLLAKHFQRNELQA
ncbi:MAG: oligosaccharide flippase family protein [Paludibacteraceae bacterium]|nr:oligosaccharide flippase family protein [Paludibacteraceae bacterium]